MKLVIAEKPSVAGDIARVIGADSKKKGYIEGNNYIVSWCVGHLIEPAMPEIYNPDFKKWDIATLPIIPEPFQNVISENTAEQYKTLCELMARKDVDELVCATDAGREGELIFRLVYDMAKSKKPFKRLWISSMEEKAIKDGFDNLRSSKDYDNLYHAALCRQQADWLVGINITRLYSCMYSHKLSVGRVQSPTINMIVRRQKEIDEFVPQTYYTITAQFNGFKAYAKATEKSKAEDIVARCKGKEAFVSKVEKQQKKENPPALFDLTTLQREANKLLGLTAQQTLDVAQKLYESKLTTYPRTDSRFLTDEMEQSATQLIEGLSQKFLQGNYGLDSVNAKKMINSKKVSDHHAIIPTTKLLQADFSELTAGLSENEKKVLYLIIFRFLTAPYAPFEYSTTKALFDIENEVFTATGREVINSGFKDVQKELTSLLKVSVDGSNEDNTEEPMLPPMSEGNTFSVVGMKSEEKQTKPPQLFTEDTLLSAMETAGKNIADEELKEAMKDSGLGTPATRASIIERIIKTGYVERQKRYLRATTQAIELMQLIPDKLREPEMTAEWEKRLSQIAKGEYSDVTFMEEISEFVSTLVNGTKILYNPAEKNNLFQTPREAIGLCPKCGKNIYENSKAYSCEAGRENCGFVIFKTIAGKTVTKAQAQQLLTKGKTSKIKGFKSKAGKSFDAALSLKDNQVSFDFGN